MHLLLCNFFSLEINCSYPPTAVFPSSSKKERGHYTIKAAVIVLIDSFTSHSIFRLSVVSTKLLRSRGFLRLRWMDIRRQYISKSGSKMENKRERCRSLLLRQQKF